MRTVHRWWVAVPAAWVLAWGLAGAAAQEEKGLDRKELDQRVHALLRDVINTGADLYNPPINDRAGCYRLYQGSLLTLRPLLDHRPELQKVIDTALADAQREGSAGERAFILRRAIDRIRADIKGPEGGKPPVAAATLWDRLGGEKAVAKVVDDFVDLATNDPKVNFTRDGKYKPDAAGVADLKKKLVELISTTTGGPLKYGGKNMKEVHKGMGITDAEFNALAADLKLALEKNGVKAPDVEALLKIVASTRADVVEEKKPEKEEKKP